MLRDEGHDRSQATAGDHQQGCAELPQGAPFCFDPFDPGFESRTAVPKERRTMLRQPGPVCALRQWLRSASHGLDQLIAFGIRHDANRLTWLDAVTRTPIHTALARRDPGRQASGSVVTSVCRSHFGRFVFPEQDGSNSDTRVK